MKLAQLKSLPQTGIVNKNKGVKYKRKSTDEVDRQIQSIAGQEDSLAPLISTPIIASFVESRSAKQPGRPEFNRMMDLIESRDDIKSLYSFDLSRLTRNPVDTARLQWALQKGKILEIVTVGRTYTEADSDILMGIDGGYANKFVRDLSKLVTRGMNSKVEKGLRPGLAPLGYKNNIYKPKGEKDIVPHPIYYPLVKKLFTLALTGRYSMMDLARFANDFKIKSSRGKEVSKQSMFKILRNPFYCGQFVYNGILYAGSHKPIITETQFDRLQDLFANPSKPHVKVPIALNGVFKCPSCASMYTYERKTKHYKNGTNQTFSYYRCGKNHGYCPEKYLAEAEADNQIKDYLGNIKISKVYVQWAVKWLARANEEKENLRKAHFESLNKAYNDIEIKLSNLFDMKISPKNVDGAMIADEDYVEQRQKLLIERKKVSRHLEELESTIDEFYDLSEKAFDFASRAKEKYINAKTIDGKKKILLTVASDLTISDRIVQFQLRKPFKLIEETLIKLKSSQISVGPEEGLFLGSNRHLSASGQLMSG